jgi:tRNA uracil 4-sulfurtransferase
MDRFIVAHYHEIGLKKGNRDYFENSLCLNIHKALGSLTDGSGAVRRISGRILIRVKPDADMARVHEALSCVFGIAYFAEAWNSDQDLGVLEANAWERMRNHSFGSFRIDAKRSEKTFPFTSVEINQRVGAYIKERSGARVDLDHAERTCWIEIVEKYALIYTHRHPGPGGLPSGTSGKVVVLLSGGIDSPVAAWKLIKRGCRAVFVHFHSFPYTNRESQEKTRQLAQALARYQFQSKLYLVPFAEVQRRIMVDTPVETRVILYRRYMMRIAAQIAHRERARVLVTGDSVGQVASQTIENIDVISRAVAMPILRPLIGDDKLEIIELARKIGTYDISIQPDQDCCSLFVPKHPETKANLRQVEESEKRLQVAEVMQNAVASAEVSENSLPASLPQDSSNLRNTEG